MRNHDWRKHSRHFGPPWQHNRRFIFWRFVLIFGGISLFFLVAIGIILFILYRQTNPDYSPLTLLVNICALPITFILVAFLLGGLAFRRLGTPFADIMSATDAIAKGDLSVRLHENNRGPLGNLARRFNNMVAELERAEQQRRNMTADIARRCILSRAISKGCWTASTSRATKISLIRWTKPVCWPVWWRTCRPSH